MQSPIVILTHVVNPAVIDGFIPAARRLGHEVILVTDQGLAHRERLTEVRILECDVFNPLAILDLLTEQAIRPAALFSNSDHLQTAAAIVARALDLPAKDWQVCYRAKDKLRMRERLTSLSLPSVWSHQLQPGATPQTDWPYPLVIKPSQGVASLDVCRVDSQHELATLLAERASSVPLLLEQFMEGPLFTLETLGDGHDLVAIGGFDVGLSAPPHFIETDARWQGPVSLAWQQQALEQIRRFGVGLGVCHSEFILTAKGPVLVEINYRSIGDGREFLLDQLLPGGWFEPILRLHLGQPLPAITPSTRQALIRYLVAERSGLLLLAPTPPSLPGLSYTALCQQGDKLLLSHSNKDYLGVIYLQADTAEALKLLHQDAMTAIHWEIN
ncbi:ATP-grasp domain-containing protein [Oceanisphaera arctica]|uniref:Carboxylate--amine ligase n=1 Tax=Oceanisphaera arctica TaxID=641510 RepID=A0A2P5TIS7_9GAMM|nr:siderophore biosynthesis protein PvsA [Oceanisphaera arctica]PPL14637.1 carboxylate--amine ligase [Oceanisphaera arctica]GHA03581.1 carboxylate--amine ligase [Oceanisphaera arctica]